MTYLNKFIFSIFIFFCYVIIKEKKGKKYEYIIKKTRSN